MTLETVYKQFPTKKDCIKHLEMIIWKNNPICPYCNSRNFSTTKNKERHHCNNCNTSYSVTVNTIFHKTRIDFQKWFYAITLLLESPNGVSARFLSKKINVTKDSALYLLNRLRKSIREDNKLIQNIYYYGK